MRSDTSKEHPSRENERYGSSEFDNNLEDFSQEKQISTVDDQSLGINTSTATQERVLANATRSARAEPEESRNGYAHSSDGAVTNHSSGPLAPGQTPENTLKVRKNASMKSPAQLSSDT